MLPVTKIGPKMIKNEEKQLIRASLDKKSRKISTRIGIGIMRGNADLNDMNECGKFGTLLTPS